MNYKKYYTGFLCLVMAVMFFGGINLKAGASVKESMTGLVVKPEVDISTTTPSGIETGELESAVDDFMENYIGKTVQGASVIIMKDGKNILSKGYGYADYENDITVSPDKTVFEFASISKMYTWVSVMQQVEKGTIDLNQDIMTYLPKSFAKKLRKNLKYDQPITMLNLMNHNAGFEDNYLDCDFSKSKDLSNNLEDALIKVIPKQVYKPGEVVSYSNFSAGLAGLIVEQVTGMPLYEYEQKYIFDVLGMKHTTADPRFNKYPDIVNNKAKGYKRGKNGLDKSVWTYTDTYPDGSLNGTAEDMSKFITALMDQESCPLFQNPDTLKEMLTTSDSPYKDITGVAHGFWEYDGKVKSYTHDGGHIGFTTIACFSPEEKFGVIVLTNTGAELSTTYGLVQYLMGDNGEIEVLPGDNLPSVDEVTNIEFIAARRNQSDVTALNAYLDGTEIAKKMGENRIRLNKLEYVQTAPYFYELVDDKDNLLVRMFYSKVYFMKHNGKVDSFSYGGMLGSYYTKVPAMNSKISRIIQLIIAGLILIMFTIGPIIMVLKQLFRKKKKENEAKVSIKNMYLTNLFGFCLTVYIINQILLARYIFTHVVILSASVNLHIAINWVILIGSITLFIMRLISFRKEKLSMIFNKKYIVITLCHILLVFILGYWNFFTFA